MPEVIRRQSVAMSGRALRALFLARIVFSFLHYMQPKDRAPKQ